MSAFANGSDLDGGPLSPMSTHFKMPGQWNKANTTRSTNSSSSQSRERVIPIQIEGRPPQVLITFTKCVLDFCA